MAVPVGALIGGMTADSEAVQRFNDSMTNVDPIGNAVRAQTGPGPLAITPVTVPSAGLCGLGVGECVLTNIDAQQVCCGPSANHASERQ